MNKYSELRALITFALLAVMISIVIGSTIYALRPEPPRRAEQIDPKPLAPIVFQDGGYDVTLTCKEVECINGISLLKRCTVVTTDSRRLGEMNYEIWPWPMVTNHCLP